MKEPSAFADRGLFSFGGKGLSDVADTGDVVHINVIKFGKLDETFHWYPHFSLFVIRVSGLGDMNRLCDLCLIEIVVVAQRFDTLNI